MCPQMPSAYPPIALMRHSANSSRRICRPHALGKLGALLPLDHADVVLALQVQPELRTVAKVQAEPNGGIGGDRAAAIQNVGDAAGWDADVERQAICAELASRHSRFRKRPG